MLGWEYRFRADLNGTQFWSGTENHCSIPSCESTSITVTIPLTVTVESQTGGPFSDLPVCVFDSDSYTSYYGTTEINGEVEFTLLRKQGFTTRKRWPMKALIEI